MWKKVLRRILKRLLDDPVDIAFCAFFNFIFAGLLAMLPSLGLILWMWILEMPIEFALGGETAKDLIKLADTVLYKVSFWVIFGSLMIDDLGLPFVKTYFRNKWHRFMSF